VRGAVYPLPNTPSWRGAQLQKSTGTTLPLLFYNLNIRVLYVDLKSVLTAFAISIVKFMNVSDPETCIYTLLNVYIEVHKANTENDLL
jgi:hypothetical protein